MLRTLLVTEKQFLPPGLTLTPNLVPSQPLWIIFLIVYMDEGCEYFYLQMEL